MSVDEAAFPASTLRVVLELPDGPVGVRPEDNGCFRFDVVPVGRWSVRVEVPTGSGLREVDADRQDFVDEPRWVEVEPGRWNEPSSYLVVARLARLAGRVTDDAGVPLTGHVWVVTADRPMDRLYLPLGADGHWHRLVQPGRYRVHASAGRYLEREYGGQEWFGPSDQPRPGVTLTVRGGEDRSGLDIPLSRWAEISGEVSDAAGRPLAGVGVGAYSADGPGSGMALATGADGRYRMAVPPRTVRLLFSGGPVLRSWYPGVPTETGATAIDLRPGEVRQGVDMRMTRGGALAGRVLDSAGRPVPSIRVTVDFERPSDALALTLPGFAPMPAVLGYAATAYTDADGRWSTGSSLFASRYVVRANGRIDSDWAPTTYGGDQPTPVPVTPPVVTRGVDLVIRRVGEPYVVSPGSVLPALTTVTLPISCPTGCAVTLATAATRRSGHRAKPKPLLLARGRAKRGAVRVRLPLTRAGRRVTRRRAHRATALVRPVKGPARSFRVRVRRAPGR